MVIAGDSAGGHLAVDLLLQHDVEHPGALVLFSPLIDLTFTLSRTREVSAHIGAAVADTAHTRKLTDRKKPADLLQDVEAHMYEPTYRCYV